MESKYLQCTKCLQAKPRDAFYVNANSRRGFSYDCKACRQEYYKKKRKEKLSYQKAYYIVNKETVLEYAKNYRNENNELIRAKAEKNRQYWQEKHINNTRRYSRSPYKLLPPGWGLILKRYSQAKGRALARNLQFELTFDQWYGRISLPCYYCSDLTTFGLDRVDSSAGYLPTNTVPCCVLCNRMKSDMPLNSFFERCCKIITKHNYAEKIASPEEIEDIFSEEDSGD